MLGGDFQGFGLILSENQGVPAQDFTRLGQRANGHDPLTVSDSHAGGSGDRMERRRTQVLTASIESQSQSDRFQHRRVVGFRPGIPPHLLVVVAEEYELLERRLGSSGFGS